MLFYTVAQSGKIWTIIENLQHNSFIDLYCTNENSEPLKSNAQASLISSQTCLTNMLDMSAITLDYVFNATPPFTDTSFKNRLWQLLLRCDNCSF